MRNLQGRDRSASFRSLPGAGRLVGASGIGRLVAATGVIAALGPPVDAGAAWAQAPERVVLSGDRVAVHNLAGEVRIEAGSGSDVVVTVTRGGADSDRLRVERRAFDGVETLIVHYPGDRVVYPRRGGGESRLRVSDDGRLYEGDRRVTVSGRGGGLEAYADLEISVPPGSDLALHHGIGEVTASGIEADVLIDISSGPVTASAMRGFLNIDTGSGAVEVRDHRGNLRIDTGSGSVRATGLAGDEVLIDTGSGSVTVARVEASQLRVDTGSGSIELGSVRATDVLLDTGSGGVDVELLERVDNLEIDTGSGGVVVYFPSDIGAQIEVETGSGGIDVEFPITVRVAERTHLVGTIGDGRGRVLIDTGSGSVRLRRR